MTGVEVDAALRKINSKVRVVLTSGLNREDSIPDTAAGFVKKPFTQGELVAVIDRVMQKERRAQ